MLRSSCNASCCLNFRVGRRRKRRLRARRCPFRSASSDCSRTGGPSGGAPADPVAGRATSVKLHASPRLPTIFFPLEPKRSTIRFAGGRAPPPLRKKPAKNPVAISSHCRAACHSKHLLLPPLPLLPRLLSWPKFSRTALRLWSVTLPRPKDLRTRSTMRGTRSPKRPCKPPCKIQPAGAKRVVSFSAEHRPSPSQAAKDGGADPFRVHRRVAQVGIAPRNFGMMSIIVRTPPRSLPDVS